MNQVREIGARPTVPASEATDGAHEALGGTSTSATSAAMEAHAEAERSRFRTRIFLNAVLISSIGAEVFILYSVSVPVVRLGLGLLPLTPIMWASARLGIVDRFARALDERKRVRRYVRFRARVVQMLEEVKRMNWVVVDMERGFCSEEAAKDELEAIQTRLRKLVDGLPDVAGLHGSASAE